MSGLFCDECGNAAFVLAVLPSELCERCQRKRREWQCACARHARLNVH